MTRVVVMDTECTGLDEDREIIEAAVIEVGRDESIDRHWLPVSPVWCQSFKPEKPIKYGAMAVHHITPAMLEGCPPSSEFQIPEDVDYIIGHSIDFDWEAAGSPAHVKRIDTHAIATWVWPECDSHSQSALLYMLLGPTDKTRKLLQGAHRAEDDALNNVRLLEKILDKCPTIEKWEDLYQYSELCRIPRVCPFHQWKGVLWSVIAEEDPSYLEWILRQDWVNSYMRQAVEDALSGNDRLPF